MMCQYLEILLMRQTDIYRLLSDNIMQLEKEPRTKT